VLLKDVFEYSLEEIAELVDSTVGGVIDHRLARDYYSFLLRALPLSTKWPLHFLLYSAIRRSCSPRLL
jgi:hypothetical protein